MPRKYSISRGLFHRLTYAFTGPHIVHRTSHIAHHSSLIAKLNSFASQDKFLLYTMHRESSHNHQPRRSVSPRSESRSRGPSRSPMSDSVGARNGHQFASRSRSRTRVGRSRNRSRSSSHRLSSRSYRGRSYSRSPSSPKYTQGSSKV